MSSFLQQIVRSNAVSLASNSLFVFPTLRAASLFKVEVFGCYNKAVELPEITTWSKFVDSSLPAKIINKEQALTLFYDVYCEETGEGEGFASFLNWAEVVYDDFEQIVLQELDGRKVFAQVEMLKVLERWDLNLSSKTNYLKIWNALPKLFVKFYEKVHNQKQATGASKYRLLKKSYQKFIPKKKDVYFCGFTVFSPTEKDLISEIKKTSNVIFFEDSPLWGSVKSSHESNRFKAENDAFFPKVIKVKDSQELIRKFQSLECGNDLSASKSISQIIGQLTDNEINDTAIVLLNDNDLPLLLNSIPKKINNINIGKGKSFGSTQEGVVFNLLLKINNQLSKKKEAPFLLIFEFLDSLMAFEILSEIDVVEMRDQILKKNLKGLNREQLFSIFENTKLNEISLLFNKKITLHSFLSKVTKINVFKWIVVKEICHKVLLKIDSISTRLKKEEFLSFFLENEIHASSVSIQGEKKTGLQIMSLLETRCLDFKNVIFLSFSDENLPQSNVNTYIPLEIRTQYRFPDQSAREAILSYHFMRLLKRSKNAHFIFVGASSFSRSGDPSRFLLQAAMEWGKEDVNFNFTSAVVKNELEPFVKNELSIEKSDKVYAEIKEYIYGRGLSPSALNVYLSNPMDFLLYHVLGLREKENVDLAVETSSLGTVVHDTLEFLYKPFVGCDFSSIDFKILKSQIKNQLIIELSKIYPELYLENGRLKILLPVLEKWIATFLLIDKKRGEVDKFKLIDVEQKFSYTIPNSETPLKLKGIVDRLENWKSCEHVVDYKTGKVDQRDLKLTTEELIAFNPEKSKAYQLLMYTYIYRGIKTGSNSLLSSIYSFRNQKNGYLPLMINNKDEIGESDMNKFEQGLIKIAESMLNRESPIALSNHRYQKFLV